MMGLAMRHHFALKQVGMFEMQQHFVWKGDDASQLESQHYFASKEDDGIQLGNRHCFALIEDGMNQLVSQRYFVLNQTAYGLPFRRQIVPRMV